MYVGTNVLKRILMWPVELWAVIEVGQIDLEHFSACPEDFKSIPLAIPNLRLLLSTMSSNSNEFCAFNDSRCRFKYSDGVLQLYQGPILLPQGPVSLPMEFLSVDALQAFLRKNSLLCPKIQGGSVEKSWV